MTIAIVGRPNVGKSTLFNRLTGQQKSITDDQSGVTRDRVYGTVTWGNKWFNLIDTGGFVPNSEDVFEAAIAEQVEIAIDEADLLLFVCDCTTGITDLDSVVADLIRRSGKNCLLVINKVDNGNRLLEAAEFYALGYEHTIFLSSINGSGTGELMDEINAFLPEEEEQEESEIPKIAIIGRPNVGKSSLTNVLLGESRNIVTDIAGTTRDSVHTNFNKFGHEMILIDTAGIRKKRKVHENLEFYSVIRSIKAIDESDVCVLLIDAVDGMNTQDLNIFGTAVEKKKAIVVVVNKWDLLEKETNTAKEYEAMLRDKMAPFNDLPIVFTSVHEKQRILKILDLSMEVFQNRSQRITTSVLNNWLEATIENYPPPAVKGKIVKINYITQLPTRTPSFALFSNFPKYIREGYRNYLENRLRESFNFHGVPVQLYFREKR